MIVGVWDEVDAEHGWSDGYFGRRINPDATDAYLDGYQAGREKRHAEALEVPAQLYGGRA